MARDRTPQHADSVRTNTLLLLPEGVAWAQLTKSVSDWTRHPSSGVCSKMTGVNDMSKTEKSNRESKKEPLLTPKEKKAAKQAKKHAGDHAPLIVKTH
jgi:hypothetical protein